MRGSFVYLLLCENPEGIYIKIGLSDDPINRLKGILTGCPLEPGILAIAELPNRERALRFEQELHCSLRHWRRAREWFLFSPEDKHEFNRRLKTTAVGFASRSWPVKWQKLPVSKLIRQAQFRKTPWIRRKQSLAVQDDVCRELRASGLPPAI